jgi:hypothetical protein
MPNIAALYNYPLYTGDTTGFHIIANDGEETTTYKVHKETLLSGFAITGSNTFKGTQTFSGSLVPVGSGSYDLGSATNPFRHLYLSSASLYIDGQKVLGSTSQELQITTDNGQSIKILEAGTDTITLQSADGDIQLKTSAGGNVLLDPTTGLIDLRGTVQVQDGNKITSSGGNSVVFGNNIVITGSILSTGTPLISGSAQLTSMGYATTGSNTFTGNQTVNGNLQVVGNLIAQQYIVSSSVTYLTESFSSGSHNFGDTLDDYHNVTGSLRITGSLLINGTSYTAATSGTSGTSGSSGTSVSVSGTNNTLTKFTSSTTVGNATNLTDDGTTFRVAENMLITGSLTVSGSNTGGVPLVAFRASGTGTFQRGIQLLNPGMTAGNSIMYSVGQADNSLNMGQFYFTYAGAGSTSNRISMGLHSADDVLNVMGSSEVLIGTTTTNSAGKLQVAGNIVPDANGTRDLGSAAYRWSTVYTSDLSLNNGIGDWTIVEGEDDLFLYNNKKGKVYKFALTEVDPNVATPKKS